MIPLQEAESHFHEITEIATEQFHIYLGADHVIVFHKYVRAWWCEDQRSDPGHLKGGHFWLEILDGQPTCRRVPREGKCTYTLLFT